MHKARWAALWKAVQSLITCRQLWLTALGRALPSGAQRKHAIKAIDRLVGNGHLHHERREIGAAIASLLIKKGARPIVLVDTMEIKHKVVAFTASLAHEGRSFPIYSMIISKLRANANECRRFLDALGDVLPANCRPVLLTDGGFESAWFEAVQLRGWDYVGRVRGLVKLKYKNQWRSCPELHLLATKRAKSLGVIEFSKAAKLQQRVVLSKRPTSRHRRRKTRRGPDNDSNYKHYRKNAHEPLLLATSLSSNAKAVVETYALRMQIEETFRDLKNHRWGWSMRHCGSRSKERVENLLVIASLGILVQQLTGIAGESHALHHRHQANTVRQRRVLSFFTLGAILLNTGDGDLLTVTSLRRALTRLRREIAHLRPSGAS
jgi:hypothetical protein